MAVTSTKWTDGASENPDLNKGFCDHRKSFKKILPLVMDGEAAQEDKLFFDNHIKNCVICAKEYQLELSIKDALKTKLEKKIVPNELIENIKLKVRANE